MSTTIQHKDLDCMILLSIKKYYFQEIFVEYVILIDFRYRDTHL